MKEDFKILFDNYFDAIRGYIYYRSGDPELATDIAQDTFMKVWEKQFNLKDKNIKSLLYKIASDLFISQYRKQKNEQKYSEEFQLEVETGTPEEEIYYNELKKKYQQVLQQMPEKKRIVFLMSRKDGLKYSEIAERLGISVKAVEKRMTQTLAILKEALIISILSWIIYNIIA